MRFIATFFTVISLVISVNCFSQNWQTSFEESIFQIGIITMLETPRVFQYI